MFYIRKETLFEVEKNIQEKSSNFHRSQDHLSLKSQRFRSKVTEWTAWLDLESRRVHDAHKLESEQPRHCGWLSSRKHERLNF